MQEQYSKHSDSSQLRSFGGTNVHENPTQARPVHVEKSTACCPRGKEILVKIFSEGSEGVLENRTSL